MSTAARPTPTAARVSRGRNRGLELLRATEASALSVGRWLGRGDKSGAREAGQDSMEDALSGMPFEGRIVIGPEGSNNRLVTGRSIGGGRDRVDLALLPVDGISLVAGGLSQALSVAASAETGGISCRRPSRTCTRLQSARRLAAPSTSAIRRRTTCAASRSP